MILKIIGLVVVVVCGIAALLSKKVAPIILKREISDDSLLKFKMTMLFAVMAGAVLVILPL